MFTAIVLVCLSGEDIVRDNCFTYTNEVLWNTEDQCKTAVMAGIKENVFTFEYTANRSWGPASFNCVPWKVKSI